MNTKPGDHILQRPNSKEPEASDCKKLLFQGPLRNTESLRNNEE